MAGFSKVEVSCAIASPLAMERSRRRMVLPPGLRIVHGAVAGQVAAALEFLGEVALPESVNTL